MYKQAKLSYSQVHASYDALINDPDIDVVFNPLPNGLHAEWSMKAMVLTTSYNSTIFQ